MHVHGSIPCVARAIATSSAWRWRSSTAPITCRTHPHKCTPHPRIPPGDVIPQAHVPRSKSRRPPHAESTPSSVHRRPARLLVPADRADRLPKCCNGCSSRQHSLSPTRRRLFWLTLVRAAETASARARGLDAGGPRPAALWRDGKASYAARLLSPPIPSPIGRHRGF